MIARIVYKYDFFNFFVHILANNIKITEKNLLAESQKILLILGYIR